MLQAIQEHNTQGGKARFIDVIGDKSKQYREVLLTSVLFDYSGLYEQMLDDLESGAFGRIYSMDVASGGVRLLDLPADVPPEVVKAVEQAKADIIAGKIKVSAIADAERMHQRLDELK
jgi:simple sugar transport system substrate-binding protein